MLSRSTKYNELPSFEMLLAYKKGELSKSDSQWVDSIVQSNEMVKAVVDDISNISKDSVIAISNKTSQKITSIYLKKVGFWTKYGTWIGLSSIVLLLGLLFYFQSSQSEALYNKKDLALDVDRVKGAKSVIADKSIAPTDYADETALVENENLEEKMVVETDFVGKTINEEVADESLEEAPEFLELTSNDNVPQVDNTREFQTKSGTEQVQFLTLAVQNVQILAKMNPNDVRVKSNSSSNSPFGANTKRSNKNNNYSLDDMPKYQGGDVGLTNYFKGKLKPININKVNDKYDRNVMIDLNIRSNGRLKDYTIHGNLYPEHQKALEKAIKDLPRFTRGTESITYTIGVSF